MIMKAKSVASYYIKFILTYSLFYFISLLLGFIAAEWLGIAKEFFPIIHTYPGNVISFFCCYIESLVLGIWLPQKIYIDCLPRIFEDNLKWFDKLYGTSNDWIPHEIVPRKLNDNFMTSRPIRFINDFSALDPIGKFVFPTGLLITYLICFIALHDINITICMFIHNFSYYIMILLHQQYMWHLLSKQHEFYHDRMKVLHRLQWLM